jgi:hypothetical protein
VRETLGFTLRDVENSSVRIAKKYGNEDYEIPLARLFDFETKDVVPSVFRMYSLAAIYRVNFHELLSWFGIGLNQIADDYESAEPKRTFLLPETPTSKSVQIPVRMDPSFDLKRTSNLGRLVEKWGALPFTKLQELSNDDYTYGYIGTDDYMMYPLLMPGTFIQVDESKNEVKEGVWRSEYERPIYFVETRDGFFCSWCSMKGDAIILHPHPLSPAPLRVLRYKREAEVLGQVVGLAMRLDQQSLPAKLLPETKGQAKLN